MIEGMVSPTNLTPLSLVRLTAEGVEYIDLFRCSRGGRVVGVECDVPKGWRDWSVVYCNVWARQVWADHFKRDIGEVPPDLIIKSPGATANPLLRPRITICSQPTDEEQKILDRQLWGMSSDA